jgi:hypothetical protein
VNLRASFDRQLLLGAGLGAHEVLGQPVVCVCDVCVE